MEKTENRYADAAAAYLTRRGYEVLERDWECPAGKCDIIANDEDGALVFVEVSGSADAEQGFPPEGIGTEKRDRYERIALAYLADYETVDVPVRFDAISLIVVGSDRALIRHHKAA